MKLRKLNKKGDISGGIEILASGLALIFIFIVFFFVIKIEDNSRDMAVRADLREINNDKMILTFLRFPIGDLTIADLAATSHSTKDYRQLETETSKLMRSLFGKEVCWNIGVGDKTISNPANDCEGVKEAQQAGVYIPTYDNKEVLFKFNIKKL